MTTGNSMSSTPIARADSSFAQTVRIHSAHMKGTDTHVRACSRTCLSSRRIAGSELRTRGEHVSYPSKVHFKHQAVPVERQRHRRRDVIIQVEGGRGWNAAQEHCSVWGGTSCRHRLRFARPCLGVHLTKEKSFSPSTLLGRVHFMWGVDSCLVFIS